MIGCRPQREMSDTGSCGGGSQPSEGSTASVKEDHSIITVDQSHENERLTTVVISNNSNDPSQNRYILKFVISKTLSHNCMDGCSNWENTIKTLVLTKYSGFFKTPTN